MPHATIAIHVERGDDELEFEASADVGFGAPARGMMGPPEYSSPEEPADVDWCEVRGDGRVLSPQEFETEFGVKLDDYRERAFDAAAEDGPDPDELADRLYDERYAYEPDYGDIYGEAE